MQRWHKRQACFWGLLAGLVCHAAVAEAQSGSERVKSPGAEAETPEAKQPALPKGGAEVKPGSKAVAPAQQVVHVEPVGALPGGAAAPPQPDPPAAPPAPAPEGRPVPASVPAGTSQSADPAPAAAAAPPVPTLAPAQEIRTLEQFEESAFPRPHVVSPRQPGAYGMDGLAPTAAAERPSAMAPPAELSSAATLSDPAAPVQAEPPAPWLAQLVPIELPLSWDPKLIRYLEFYRQSPYGRAIMRSWLQRLGRYQQMISEVLQQYELPQDLIYLAMVESGFDPSVTSRVGAAGLWQFMPGPGRGYGLRRDYWVDERRNPRKSTEAAARYLKALYEKLGSWELAMAAYNAGAGTVIRSIRKYNTNDYWQICQYEAGLPWETTFYVPKVLAAAIVGHNRAFFGFDDIPQDQELVSSLVAVPTSVSLVQIARAAGVNKALIAALNPELRRGRTPPAEKVWVRVPRGTEDRFYAGLAELKGQLARYKPYLVRLGDTVERIAAQHGMTPASLRQANGLRQLAELRPGLTILVSAKPAPAVASDGDAAGEEQECLLVPLPLGKQQQLPGRQRVFYRTTIGDSLPEIAQHLQVEPAELADWNGLNPDATLISGMVLQAFVKQGFARDKVVLLDPSSLQLMTTGSESFLSAYEECNGRRRVVYTVRPGDTLSSIGRRFSLSVGSLARINRFDRRTKLDAGQKVVVYVNKAKAKAKAKAKEERRSRQKRRRRRAAKQAETIKARAARARGKRPGAERSAETAVQRRPAGPGASGSSSRGDRSRSAP